MIDLGNPKYSHNQGEGTVVLPDLDGIPMKSLHKLLDLKRQKCSRDHAEDEDGWILSAFS